MNSRNSHEAPRPVLGRSALLGPDACVGLWLVCLLSLVPRLLWLGLGPKAIEVEGSLYARVGEGIAMGRGLLDVPCIEGVFLVHPPLYPALIADGIRLGLGSETAGRIVSLLFGIPLPVVICLIGRRLYGPAAGWLGGLVAAVHPLLIVLSAAVLSEPASLTLTALAVYFYLGVLDLGSPRSAILAGLCLGLSYLFRPEALILAAIFAIAAVATNLPRIRLAMARALLFLSTFSVLALPYVLLVSIETGQIRFEAKTPDALATMLRSEQGQDTCQMRCAIGHDLVGTGIDMITTRELVRTLPSTPKAVWLRIKQAKLNLGWLLRSVSALYLGQPLIGALAALGCFASAWSRRRLQQELPLVAIVLLTILAATTTPHLHDRFWFGLLPPLLIWAGPGLDRLRDWARGTATQCGLRAGASARLAAATVTTCVTLISAAAVIGVRHTDELSQSWEPSFTEELRLGKEIEACLGRRARIMDTRYVAAYYANAVVNTYPWTDGDTASRYITKRGIEYLILRDRDNRRYPHPPYFEELARSGLGGRAQLISTLRGESGCGYDLRLMSSLNDVSGIPTEGKNLIIVATVNNVLHFRIFDGDGKVVVDTDEKRLTEQARQIEDLKKQLEGLWPPHQLTRSEKEQVIAAVTSIVGHTPGCAVRIYRWRGTPPDVPNSAP